MLGTRNYFSLDICTTSYYQLGDNSFYFWVHTLCWYILLTSTSLCLGQGTISALIHTTSYYQLDDNSFYFWVHTLCWYILLTSTSLCLGQGTISALIYTTSYYQLDDNSFLLLGTYFVLVYITN